MPEKAAAEALVSIGSNVTPERHLPRAVRIIGEHFAVRALSSAWSTHPIGPPGQPRFLNAAAVIAVEEPPLRLRDALRELERTLGRERSADRFAPRPIDLDLLLYGQLRIDEDDLRLPDPDLLQQVYLTVPAAEVAPDWVHPVSGERLQDIAARLLAAMPARTRPRKRSLRLLASAGA